jgi:hypothetical protein
MKSIIKALGWYFWNVGLGLAPFLIFGYLWFSFEDAKMTNLIKYEIVHLLKDCVIMFFCVALTGSVSLDIMFSKCKFSAGIYFIAGMVPFFNLLIGALSYSALLVTEFSNFHFLKSILTQLSLLFCSSLFSIFSKTLLINKEIKYKQYE